MNFFNAQDKARRSTARLVFLFALAVLSLIILTNLLVAGAFVYMDMHPGQHFLPLLLQNLDKKTIALVTLGVTLLILLGSIYKILLLSKGGPAIAEMLGGQLISRSTNDKEEKRLLNVVDEMAIAAGMPVPRVYLLPEHGINAFAAGQSHNTAVIGITRGALQTLNRDELQGVIAHEFSHILNGDMRLNLRLIGVLHGILLIGIVGEYILRSIRHRSGKKDNAAAILLIGLGLMIIGYAGTFFGKWIKASVSRQREYLADASAVQFTRNSNSIAGALKKIGGLEYGSQLQNPSAAEYDHAYFATGVSDWLSSMFATHPPLDKRIKAIEPEWDGNYIVPAAKATASEEQDSDRRNPFMAVAGASAAVVIASEQILQQIGTINQNNIDYARQVLLTLPADLKNAAENPWSARAIVYTLLLREQKNRDLALKQLHQHADATMPPLVEQLLPLSHTLDDTLMLPLLELSVSALQELSKEQYQTFRKTIKKIIAADNKVDLHEWIIQRMVLTQLDEHFALRKPAVPRHALLGAVKTEAETLLSLIAYIEHPDDSSLARHAFDRGKKDIGAAALNIVPRESLSLDTLNQAVDRLMELKPLLKARFLKGCAAIILADGKTTRKGVEIFRAVAMNLDCPVPPLPAEL